MYRAAICDDDEGLARLVMEKLNAYKAQHEKGTTSQVILLTGYEEYAIEACGMAAGYVMKDTLDERLPEALERAFRNLARTETRLTTPSGNGKRQSPIPLM